MENKLRVAEEVSPEVAMEARAADELGLMASRGFALGSAVMAQALGRFGMDEAEGNAVAQQIFSDMVIDLQPRSMVERHLVEQLAVTQTLLLVVQQLIGAVASFDRVDQMVGVAARLQNEYRRTLQMLQVWRGPSRPIVVAQQANFGGNQFISQAGS